MVHSEFSTEYIVSLLKTSHNLLYVNGMINGIKGKILIDNGSGISITNKKFIYSSFKAQPVRIKGITGSEIIDRKSLVNFSIYGINLRMEAWVVETNHDLLLGNDFLEKCIPS